jgi:ribosomal protein S18 acetylase RimI-like enzyme
VSATDTHSLRRAVRSDAAAIARIYTAVFGDQGISRLGAAFAEEYFAMLLSADNALGVVADDASGGIAGFAIGFLGASGTRWRRFAPHALGLARRAVAAVARHPSILRHVVRGVASHTAPIGTDTDAFLAAIAVSPVARGRGIGSAMLARFIAVSRDAGARQILLEASRHSDAAVTMYERAGFEWTDIPGRSITKGDRGTMSLDLQPGAAR